MRHHRFARLRSRTLLAIAPLLALLGSTLLAVSAPAQAAEASPAAYGTNVALATAGGTATASGSEGDGAYGWTPDKAIDGITSGPSGQNTSRWSSNYADDAWIAVRLARPTTIDHVTIYWETACAAEYKLQVSVDGTTWVDAAAPVQPTCDSKDVQRLGAQADPATAYQHVRMQTIRRTAIGGQLYGVSLWELEVWDGAEPAAAAGLPLVPRPLRVTPTDGAEPYAVQPGTAVIASGDAAGSATLLAEDLRRATGYAIPVRPTAEAGATGDITVVVDPGADYATAGPAGTEEAYRLDVAASGVTITAASAHGAFNATQTLRQLLPAWVRSPVAVRSPLTAPAVSIEDAPRFAYRGVMIDVARSFQTVDEIKAQIDTLAGFKMSHLHLHLADDQGWRIEITNDGKAAGDPIDYTRLTSVSGRTAMDRQGYRNEAGRTGYYTQADYREIVAYARERHVEVVPEVDVPSHTNAALHAIPQLNTARSLPAFDPKTGVVPWNGTGNVGYSALDEQHDLTYTFIEHVFGQLGDLTGGTYVHLGGDESHDMGHSRYVDFITRAVPRVRTATAMGTIGWTEYAEAGLSQGSDFWTGSVVQYWVGSGDWVRDFVAKGGKAIVSAAGGAYIDQKYDPSTPIGLSWACSGSCDFDRYYGWEPTTTVTGGLAESGVLGVEAPLWSETVRGGDQSEFLVLPRAAAVLETGWTTQANKDVDDFGRRLGVLGQRLTASGSNFYETPRTTWAASATGVDLVARPGVEAAWPVGLVAAPGTKLGASGASIVPDTVATDGDPSSRSALTSPLTGRFVCGTTELPVTFTTARPRDNLHAAGLYAATVRGPFTAAAECRLLLSGGLEATSDVTVSVAADAPLPPAPFTPTEPAAITLGNGTGPVVAGEWTRLVLRGFDDRDHVLLKAGDRALNSVRADARGSFTGLIPLPADLYAGEATITATQGERTASVTVTVDSDVRPLPDLIDQSTITVADVDSEETVGEDGRAVNAIDGNPATFWHTEWYNAAPSFPHHITLDLGRLHDVTGLAYLRRQNADNGVFKDYEIYVSEDGSSWGAAVTRGTFTSALTIQNVPFAAKRGRYVKLVGLSSLPGNVFGGAAEINVGGRPVASGVAPKVTATAAVKCTASGAGLAVDVTNDGTVATDLVVRSDFGEHAVSGVAPGATTSHVFPIDTRTVAAGGVTVKARTNADGIPLEATVTADYAAADCRAEATLRARLAKDTIRAGQSGTINVTVTGAQGRATGTVVASEGDIELLGATLDPRGGASIRLPRTLEVGEHVLVVRYSGDGTYRPATTEVTLTVT